MKIGKLRATLTALVAVGLASGPVITPTGVAIEIGEGTSSHSLEPNINMARDLGNADASQHSNWD